MLNEKTEVAFVQHHSVILLAIARKACSTLKAHHVWQGNNEAVNQWRQYLCFSWLSVETATYLIGRTLTQSSSSSEVYIVWHIKVYDYCERSNSRRKTSASLPSLVWQIRSAPVMSRCTDKPSSALLHHCTVKHHLFCSLKKKYVMETCVKSELFPFITMKTLQTMMKVSIEFTSLHLESFTCAAPTGEAAAVNEERTLQADKMSMESEFVCNVIELVFST